MSKYEVGTLFYRYEASISSYGSGLLLRTFVVVKVTPKGSWIARGGYFQGEAKFVLDHGARAYAYPTKALAMKSFRLRCHHRLGHAISAMEKAATALSIALCKDRSRMRNESGQIWDQLGYGEEELAMTPSTGLEVMEERARRMIECIHKINGGLIL